jgi:hypothetical protein
MKTETNISAEDAEAILKRDELNKLEGLTKRGRLLTEKDRSQLRRVIRRAKRNRNVLPPVKKKQLETPPLKSLEGRYLTRVRRRQVYMLRMQNKTVREMCEALQAGPATIIEDLKQIDEALKKDIDSALGTEILNEKLLELEGLKVMAIQGAEDSEGNEQIGYLNTAAKINELQAKLLQDAGIIRKVAAKHELTGKDGAPLPAAAPLATEIVISMSEQDEDVPKDKVIRLKPVHGSEVKRAISRT